MSAPWSDQRQPLPGTAPHCAGVASVRTVRRGDNTTHTALLSKPQDMQRRAQIHQEHAALPHIQLPVRRACSRPSNTARSPEPIQQHSVLPVGGQATLGLSDANLLGGEARVGGTASTSGIPGAVQGRRRPHHGQLPLQAQVREYGGGTSTHDFWGTQQRPNSAPQRDSLLTSGQLSNCHGSQKDPKDRPHQPAARRAGQPQRGPRAVWLLRLEAPSPAACPMRPARPAEGCGRARRAPPAFAALPCHPRRGRASAHPVTLTVCDSWETSWVHTLHTARRFSGICTELRAN